GTAEEILGELLQPRQPWRQILRRYLVATARSDYSWRRPNKRLLGAGVIAPSLHSRGATIDVFVDTSGSIPSRLAQEFLGELQGIIDQNRDVLLVVYQGDVRMTRRTEYAHGDRIDPVVVGRGGTDHTWIVKPISQDQPHLVLILTDSYTVWPEERPAPSHVPVLILTPAEHGDLPEWDHVEVEMVE
ncbi:MAG: VWA-like domain-containing protein, partial [Conexivisphaera sp.]